MKRITKSLILLLALINTGCDSGAFGVTPCVAAKAEWTQDSDLRRKVSKKTSKMSSSELYDFNLAAVNCIDGHNHSWMK